MSGGDGVILSCCSGTEDLGGGTVFLIATSIARVCLWCRGEDHMAMSSMCRRMAAIKLELSH